MVYFKRQKFNDVIHCAGNVCQKFSNCIWDVLHRSRTSKIENKALQ